MDGQPEILSSGPQGRWPRLGPGRPVTAVALAVLLLACFGALGYTAVQLAHRDSTIHELRAAQQRAAQQQRSATTGSEGLPAVAGIAAIPFPGSADGTFSMVAAALRPRPGAPPLTWLFVYGRHATPGARYSLLDGTCGGQFVTPDDAAQGIADSKGDLTIVATNLPFGAQDRRAWVLVYRARDGITLGGVRGPFIGGRPVPFRATPPC
ncbi:MAG TPA: hypothetical protein VGM53_34845 [Streptosporangiaceae bacterium]|jgi:hypothetical protein